LTEPLLKLPYSEEELLQGLTPQTAYAQALEAVHLQLAELAKAGVQIPRPGKVADYRKCPELKGTEDINFCH
tara:strand:- start:4140 stop:4355 length:216 start_codon:yes stop_codon:yes gene_type:complete